MLTKECPEYLRPGYDRVEETLHGPVAAAFCCPARQTQHRYSARHGYHCYNDPAQLPQSRFGNAVLYRL